ncbi:MAG TPA: relaxase/mobilization nuclease domain-containing protein [Methylibium sp.]|nr:relaxase/mobilization nuclease domain-containing protein [Methylibium sp.]
MILKGSQRGGSAQLARHLLKAEENEHVALHELRGFMAEDLTSALHEAYAVSRGTRAKQFLFSLSLNPPAQERVSIDEFEAAIEQVEQKLGLGGQPRAVVFHEKEGRRHAHVVWSRIDAQEMKAINLPHYKLKLRDVSRALYLEHGWRMPRGLADAREKDPRNFTRDEWEQAKRNQRDPRALKTLFRECWLISDSRAAFAAALKARGYSLARGDRRGHVAVDFRGEVYAIAKWTGFRAKEVRDRLGDESLLPSVAEVKAQVATRMTDMIREHVAAAERAFAKQKEALIAQRREVVERQRREREALAERHEKRRAMEGAERAQRVSRGLQGLWDRLTGTYGKTTRRNEIEAWEAMQRDRRETDTLIARHLDERQGIHDAARAARAMHEKEVAQLNRDVSTLLYPEAARERSDIRAQFRDAARGRRRDGDGRVRGRGFDLD